MKKLKLALLGVALTAAAGQASAGVVFTENWAFDPTGTGIGASTVTPIDEMNYLGVSFTDSTGFAPGDTFSDSGRFGATSFQNDGSVIPAGVSGLGVDYEISATFLDWTGTYGATAGNNTAFTFDAGGTLDMFIDNTFNNTDFAGAGDGTNILSLAINTGSGNINFGNTAGVDGNVDILFDVTFAAAGYWFLDTDGDGVAETDLSTLSGISIGLTDSNNAITDPTAAVRADFAANSGLSGDDTLLEDIYTLNDGSATIGADIPEPSIIALLSIGLLSIGAATRRKA